MNYTIISIIHEVLRRKGLSERSLANISDLSRTSLRAVINFDRNLTFKSFFRLMETLNIESSIYTCLEHSSSEYSIPVVAHKINLDGFASWKIHLMNFVDEFRRTLDTRLIIMPPPTNTDKKILALLAATVYQLTFELQISCPGWAKKMYFLATPWFVAETQALKASALLESPLPFRRNNIFVHTDFLTRI